MRGRWVMPRRLVGGGQLHGLLRNFGVAAAQIDALMVPGALLLTIRHVFESSSRPMFELLLLTPAEMETDTVAAHWPVRFEAVAVFLAVAVAVRVVDDWARFRCAG